MSAFGSSDLLERATSLRAEISSRAEEVESSGRVAPDLIATLADSGFFRMLVPHEFGGDEVDLDIATAVCTEIARANTSVGWQVLVGAGNQYFLGKLPKETMHIAMSVGDPLVKGALAPKGIAKEVPGGFRLTGRWPLASGSFEPSWVPGGFLIMEENGPRKLPNGAPDLRIAVLAPDQVRWLDTWDSMGLRGSQSQDFEVEDLFVPEEWTGSFFAPSSIDSPWYTLPPMPTAPMFAAMIVGALKGAIDDLSELAPNKKPAFGPGKTLAEDPVFTTRFGELAAQVDMLEIVNNHIAVSMMEVARTGQAPEPLEYQRLHAMNARIHHSGPAIADQLVDLAGSTALYASHPLQQRWRDIRCAAQHVSGQVSHFTQLGNMLSTP